MRHDKDAEGRPRGVNTSKHERRRHEFLRGVQKRQNQAINEWTGIRRGGFAKGARR